MSLLNVAVWGLGIHAKKRILPLLFAIDEIELVGVCSRNRDVVEECADQWNCCGWTDPEQMLRNNDVDVVYIATPIGIHFALAKQVLEAGKHAWCEKPVTCSYADTKLLVSIAQAKGKVLAESFMYLYHPQFQRVKKFIDDSEGVHSVICRFGIPTLNNPGFRNDPKLGGGALWDVGAYTASAVLSLFPGQEIEIMYADVITKKELQVDSSGRALLRFANGVTAYLEWAVGVAYRNEIDIWAINGSFFTDKIFSKPKDYQPQYKTRDIEGNESLATGQQSEQFSNMFRHFIGMINNREKAASELENILQRAKLMNNILYF